MTSRGEEHIETNLSRPPGMKVNSNSITKEYNMIPHMRCSPLAEGSCAVSICPQSKCRTAIRSQFLQERGRYGLLLRILYANRVTHVFLVLLTR